MLPMALINFVVAAIWHYSGNWGLPAGFVLRWLICGALVLIPYLLFARLFTRRFVPRTYRYAD